jgi:hypothetical protein
MGTTIWISGGEVGLPLHVVTHSYNTNKAIAEIGIPGATKSEFQNMGSKGKNIGVTGWTSINADVEQIKSWESSGTSLCYSGTKAYLSGCILSNFTYSEESSPNTYPVNYSFSLREL